MIKILAIGNSFSQDATRYLHSLCKANDVEIKCVNLYIPGCSLRTHYLNMLEDEKKYGFEFNGISTGIYVTMKEAIMSDEWDIVTLQQASPVSFKFDTYTPYIEKLKEYVHIYCPNAKIYLHQTWCYEEESKKLFSVGYNKSEDMFRDIKASYKRAASLIDADGMIKSGEAMYQLSKHKCAYRDSFHASLGVGRYLLAKVWYSAIVGENAKNEILEFDQEITSDEIKIINQIVERVKYNEEVANW